MPGKVKGLLERLNDKEPVLVAEGYLFEFERRGYLQAGCFVPEVVIEHPELVKQLSEEFVHAGSDVVEAFTYYAHREKMALIGREHELEKINRDALRIARQVADETGTLMAGNICNTTVFAPNEEGRARVAAIFKEQVQWAAEEGADYIIGETHQFLEEALIALKTIKTYAKGLPAVIMLAASATGNVMEGKSLAEACKELEDNGADVVGLNCMRGLSTILEPMKAIRAACKGHIACLPVPYRTTDSALVMIDMVQPDTGEICFPDQMDSMLIPRKDVIPFTKSLLDMNILYIGLCCGNRGFYMRAMAEAAGRKPPASKYSTDMSKHFSTFKDKSGKNSAATDAWNQNTSVHKVKKAETA